eukprot:6797519-Prymnesium_polylepis.1
MPTASSVETFSHKPSVASMANSSEGAIACRHTSGVPLKPGNCAAGARALPKALPSEQPPDTRRACPRRSSHARTDPAHGTHKARTHTRHTHKARLHTRHTHKARTHTRHARTQGTHAQGTHTHTRHAQHSTRAAPRTLQRVERSTSPSARATPRQPPSRPASIVPPSEHTRTRSAWHEREWSSVRATAAPSRHSTACRPTEGGTCERGVRARGG